MVTSTFSLSVGDFIAAIQLVVKISDASKETGGASTELKFLYQELQQLRLVLEQLRDLPDDASPSQNHLDAVRGMVLTVKQLLEEFVAKIEKYKTTMQSNRPWRGVGRKVQWAVGMKEDVDRFRAMITMKIVTISILLAIPTGCDNLQIYSMLHSIQSNIPSSPSETLDDDIPFTDVLGRKSKLPYAYFRHADIFEARLECESKGLPGEDRVLQGRYEIVMTKPPYHFVTGKQWQQLAQNVQDARVLLVRDESSPMVGGPGLHVRLAIHPLFPPRQIHGDVNSPYFHFL
ncbi:hypothetical protein AOQ84DRAFT_372060 [Glonium stellatum]|uniref:Fungal N-terminal domain-containing protein n=1 Tax=Glonium stellatum TaxID=574774 RepID=A0A8E2FAH4_9PEZI|nr:hypothetical protein AOQ84DRAFT_372060 [Glonium stellatum]